MSEELQRSYIEKATQKLQVLAGSPLHSFRSPRVKKSAKNIKYISNMAIWLMFLPADFGMNAKVNLPGPAISVWPSRYKIAATLQTSGCNFPHPHALIHGSQSHGQNIGSAQGFSSCLLSIRSNKKK